MAGVLRLGGSKRHQVRRDRMKSLRILELTGALEIIFSEIRKLKSRKLSFPKSCIKVWNNHFVFV